MRQQDVYMLHHERVAQKRVVPSCRVRARYRSVLATGRLAFTCMQYVYSRRKSTVATAHPAGCRVCPGNASCKAHPHLDKQAPLPLCCACGASSGGAAEASQVHRTLAQNSTTFAPARTASPRCCCPVPVAKQTKRRLCESLCT